MEGLKHGIQDARKKYTLLTTFDVRNAFNTASWGLILRRLREKDISTYLTNLIASYLSERKVGMARLNRELTAGFPQESVLGPTLWNVLYDNVFELEFPAGVQICGYADDLAIIANADRKEEVELNANEAMSMISVRMMENGLKLAPEKTEALMANIRISWNLRLEGTQIAVKRKLKTVSIAATQVISGTPPIDLLAEKRKLMFQKRSGYENSGKARKRTIQKWQEEWDSHVDTAQWTKRLIPNISQWITCKFRNTNYFFMQALTGHESFTAYTHQISKTVNDRCRYCGDTDTLEHTLFSCIRCEVRRGAAKVYLGKDTDTHV
ncbi:hypothetical protein NQ315_000526 [Exocentrus adspersus]|uniref:Reverse transcriptase domain-containing protein n=1 Tax=Exocentrus adspersus TaxID=1586481 RepID=A0AAV8VD28_9CUCU|nr:hypothetical protein NQ315_000526 [Exocentrus adspersus]